MQLRITRDPHNWILQKFVEGGINSRTGRIGPDHWKDIGYYGQLFELASAALNRSIVVPEGLLEEQVPALLRAIKEAEARLTIMLKAEHNEE